MVCKPIGTSTTHSPVASVHSTFLSLYKYEPSTKTFTLSDGNEVPEYVVLIRTLNDEMSLKSTALCTDV